MKKSLMYILLIIAVLSFGCEYSMQKNQGLFDDLEIKRASSSEEIEQLFANQRYGYYRDSGPMVATMDLAMTESASPTSGTAQRDFSETNIQVEGVDEADLLKTDGTYVYTISDRTVFIVKAYPGEEAEVVSILKSNQSPSNLFIQDDKLVVMGHFNSRQYLSDFNLPTTPATFIEVYDISDKESPRLISDYKVQGTYKEARLKGGYVYLFAESRSYQRPTPFMIENDVLRSAPLNSVYYFDKQYQSPSQLHVYSLDLARDSMESVSVIVESNTNLYVSHDNIFITHTERIDEDKITMNVLDEIVYPRLSRDEKNLVKEIDEINPRILNDWQKMELKMEVYAEYASRLPTAEMDELEKRVVEKVKEYMDEIKSFEHTIITRISYQNGKLNPSAMGEVPGRVLNQFSMDEDTNTNVFRIATTISRRWDSMTRDTIPSTNNVYTLDNQLRVLDGLEGLAEDERIYSARFVDDKLYMVTFREIDPFFVIDLSNPRNIRNLGELKIPGFSTYLHPYDEDTIIGIGQEADERGRILGLKISLFDVSDNENPIEIAKYVGDDRYARSHALYEHKAFLFNKERDLLVIPVYSRGETQVDEVLDGALVFKITKDSIELRGLIDHSKTDVHRFNPSVERSFYIEDLLYTKSQSLIRINNLEDLSSVGNVSLTIPRDIPIY